jgi:hypothetical protein
MTESVAHNIVQKKMSFQLAFHRPYKLSSKWNDSATRISQAIQIEFNRERLHSPSFMKSFRLRTTFLGGTTASFFSFFFLGVFFLGVFFFLAGALFLLVP